MSSHRSSVPPASTPGTRDAPCPRARTSFDAGWRFHLGDATEGHRPALNDSQWQSVDLPHDWSIALPFSSDHASGTGYLPGGIGWYRKRFHLPHGHDELAIEFDGIYRNSDVWINGHHLGHRPYGYSSFHYRLTPHLRRGETNVIAVRVERENVADSRWYPGSGIYRHCWLTRTAPLHITPWGVFVTTPRTAKEQADVQIAVELRNDGSVTRTPRIVTDILDPGGAIVCSAASTIEIPRETTGTTLHGQVVPFPRCWSPDSPSLYTVRTRLLDGDTCIDSTSTPFGIRSFHFDANRGFFLNGAATTLKGVCMHHDGGMVGAAVPESVLERRLQRVKEIGGNAVRCSHNPMAPEFYDLCDRIGLLVMNEAFDEWEPGKRKWEDGRNVGVAERFGYADAFAAWGVRDCEDMVRRDRNHPSIILWSIGNEIDYPGDPYVHPECFDPGAPPADDNAPPMAHLTRLAPRLVAAVKRHDPTRPVTMALSNLPAANAVGLPRLLDVVGYNYQEQFYRQDHASFPTRVILGSENGRGAGPWQAVAENDFISGQFIWAGFDFLGEAGPWPNHASGAGLFDTRGFRKPTGWIQQALWSEHPFVRLFTLDATPAQPYGLPAARYPRRWAAPPGRTVRVAVITNCTHVDLHLDGVPAGQGRPPATGWFELDVPYQPGRLTAAGFRTGEEVAHDCLETTGPVHHLECTARETTLHHPGVAHIEVRTVDQEGRCVTDADVCVCARVEGPGLLLGLDNGDTNDPTLLTSPSRRVTDGRLLALVRATGTGDVITLTATAKGLQTGSIQLDCNHGPGTPPDARMVQRVDRASNPWTPDPGPG